MHILWQWLGVCCSETTGEVRLLDLEELQRQLDEKQREIQEFRLYREQVEKRRDTERQERNKLKIRQLELFEEMQVSLSWSRVSCCIVSFIYPTSDTNLCSNGLNKVNQLQCNVTKLCNVVSHDVRCMTFI